MNNIAFPVAAVIGPKVFHCFNDKLINYGYNIYQTNSSVLEYRPKGNNCKSNVTELISAVFSVFLAKRDVSEI